MPRPDPAPRKPVPSVFTVRPGGQARGLLAALRARGLPACNLAPVRLVGLDPGATLSGLAERADRWLFTSPAAVRFLRLAATRHGLALFAPGAALATLAGRGRVFAPGPGTARALARAGIAGARQPATTRDSEGLLALPALAAPLDGTLALVGAPQGRGLLAPALAARGATVVELMVYRRQQTAPQAAALRALAAAASPLLVVGSAALLEALWQALPTALQGHLRTRGRLVVASPRIAAVADRMGLPVAAIAASATAADLAAATRGVTGPDRPPEAARG